MAGTEIKSIVYRFTNHLGQKYIGSKKKCYLKDNAIFDRFGNKYFTSSTNDDFKNSLKNENYLLEVLFSTDDLSLSIRRIERDFQIQNNVISDPDYVNKKLEGFPDPSPESRQKQSKFRKNLYQDPVERRKQSEIRKKVLAEPSQRKGISDRAKEMWKSPKHRQKISESHSGKFTVLNKLTKMHEWVSKSNFNPKIHEFSTSKKVSAYDLSLKKIVTVDSSVFWQNKENYLTFNSKRYKEMFL